MINGIAFELPVQFKSHYLNVARLLNSFKTTQSNMVIIKLTLILQKLDLILANAFYVCKTEINPIPSNFHKVSPICILRNYRIKHKEFEVLTSSSSCLSSCQYR